MIDERDGFSGNLENFVTAKSKKLRDKSFADYLDTSIVVMIIGIIIAIILTFFVTFIFDPRFDWKEVGVNTVLITACTLAVYLLVRYYAMRKGRKTGVWVDASERVKRLGKTIIDSDKAKLIPKYCRAWEDERLKSDITVALAPVGITYEGFKAKYAVLGKKELAGKYPDLTTYQVKAILRTKKIKRLKFCERYFFVNAASSNRGRVPGGGLKTKQLNRLTIARMALTSLITSLVSATLLRDIIIDFSAASIIKCVIKLAIIIFFGAIAMIGGYTFTSVKEVNEMNAKSDEIEVFLKWCGEKE